MKIIYLIFGIFLLALIFLPSLVSATVPPDMAGIAINEYTKECAGYFSGDENINYKVPVNWYAAFVASSIRSGSCSVSITLETKICCEELGLTYVSDNIGKDYSDTYLQGFVDTTITPIDNSKGIKMVIILSIVGLAVIGLVVWIVLYFFREPVIEEWVTRKRFKKYLILNK